jgi:hypothetical protein
VTAQSVEAVNEVMHATVTAISDYFEGIHQGLDARRLHLCCVLFWPHASSVVRGSLRTTLTAYEDGLVLTLLTIKTLLAISNKISLFLDILNLTKHVECH